MRRKGFILASTSRKQQITEKDQGKKPKKKPWMNMLIGLLGHFFFFFLFFFLAIYFLTNLFISCTDVLTLVFPPSYPPRSSTCVKQANTTFPETAPYTGACALPHQSTLKTVPHRRDIDQLDVGNHSVVKKEESYNLKVNELYLVVSLNACYFLLN